MNLQCQESELSKPSICETTPPRPYLLSKPPQQSHLWGTENSNAVGYRGCLRARDLLIGRSGRLETVEQTVPVSWYPQSQSLSKSSSGSLSL